MVYLIGAGPGDPGLITVKALDLVKRADVILYDYLIGIELLDNAREDCELIDVGKSAGNHKKTQDETCDLLVEFGKKHSIVVRLKGGDPFTFGRGGEEAQILRKNGVPFEIVPGVSALSSVPAYAGIPLTHRDFASSVGFATGHGASGKSEDPIHWRELAGSVDTIVVFMGVGSMESIIGELKAGGRSGDTPAALVEKGTTSQQRVVAATLDTLKDRAAEENVKPPALLIVGNTVTLHDKIDWFYPGPLSGLRIGITRPAGRAAGFSDKLRKSGAEPVLMPTIKTVDTIDTPEVAGALDNLASCDSVLFFSANGVESFLRALKKKGMDTAVLDGKLVGAIGPATAEMLTDSGVTVNIRAKLFIAEGLLDAVQGQMNPEGKKFLLVRSDIGRDIVPEGLRNIGADVEDVVFYSTQQETVTPDVIKRIVRGEVDIITFTSSSTVNGYVDSMKGHDVPGSVKFASIGPETSKALQKHGIEPHITASEYTTDGLLDAILHTEGKE